jgi:hypothetical protein
VSYMIRIRAMLIAQTSTCSPNGLIRTSRSESISLSLRRNSSTRQRADGPGPAHRPTSRQTSKAYLISCSLSSVVIRL